jgi:hypothetical protein
MISQGDQRNQPIGPLANGQSVFVDRESEARRLREAILKRESLVICGPAGIGKTALVSRVLSGLEPDLAQRSLYVSGASGLQPFLRRMLEALHCAGDQTLRCQLRSERICQADFRRWLKVQCSSRLKGSLYRALEGENYWVFLDHISALSHAMAKVLKEIVRMRNTPVYFVDRGLRTGEVGPLADVYWSDQQRLLLDPLPEPAARELLEGCIRKPGLERLDLKDFLADALRLSGRNPGVIVRMCALAAEPRYWYGSRIKTRLIYVDGLIHDRKSAFEREGRREVGHDA